MRRIARRCAHCGVAVAILVAVLAGCGGGDDSIVVSPPAAGPSTTGDGSDSCRVGGQSATPALRPGTETLVLGCGRLLSGRRLEITGYREPRREGGLLCVGYWVPRSGHAGGCLDDRVPAGRAIDPLSYGRLDDATTMLFGNSSLRVASVAMRLGSSERGAGLARITRPQLLRRLRVSRPFAVYFAEVPTEALRSPRHVVVEARDQRGELLEEEITRAPAVITG